MRYFFIPILHPGELQSMYSLDRESDNVWRYYSIVRTGKNANGLIARNKPSAVNRAVAFYRHLVGIPTAQEPQVDAVRPKWDKRTSRDGRGTKLGPSSLFLTSVVLLEGSP